MFKEASTEVFYSLFFEVPMRSVQQLIRRVRSPSQIREEKCRPSKNEYDYTKLLELGPLAASLANGLSSGKSRKKVLILEAGGWALESSYTYPCWCVFCF